tara:strand:- start:865 stop:2973 length:2109 start_codon:yes stop_codon:yes gene_type:complete
MPLVNFSNLDFDQVKTTLKNYLKSNSNFTDYDFEGSNLSTILNVLAYNTYLTSYNANMVANEVFIDSATLRENVVSLARNIGYLPRSRKAATAFITFFVDTTNITPRPSTVTLKAGPIASSSGNFGNSSYVFSITEDITVPVVDNTAEFNNVKINEGSLLTSNFTYSSRDPNQKFILPNIGIDTDLINISVKTDNSQFAPSTKYTRQDSLFEIDKNSNVFYLQESDDEQYEIFFGDNVFGKALEDGNFISANYIVSNGDAANGINAFQFAGRLVYTQGSTEYAVTSGISLLTTAGASSGGDSIESVDSVKKYAPRIYASQNRALTANDYESLIPTKIYPETESISVFGGEELIPPQYGKVFISIKPRFGDFLPNLIKQNIKNKLKKYAVAGIVPEILDLKYLYVEIHSSVYYNTNLAPSADSIGTLVSDNTKKYADSSDLNKYGARFKYSKFLNIIDNSSDAVTSNITKVYMRRDLRIAVNSFAEYAIGFGNAFHVKRASGYNIKSSAFKINGIDQTVYLSDLPNNDLKTGSLFFFTLPSLNSKTPTIVRRNVGTIDYQAGIVILNPVNITDGKEKDGQKIIEISTSPLSNDVIGLQDLYLQLDISNSAFDMIIDEISSGLDPSASSYIVSSSYDTGNLVRSGGPVTSSIDSVTTSSAGVPSTTTATTSSSTTTSTTSTSSPSTPSSGGSSGGGGGGGYGGY